MSQQQQPQRPLTFSDVLPVSGALASQPVTKQDAALMQRTEVLNLGQVQRGGAAASMQSAADHNVQAGTISEDAQTAVANEGITFGDVFSVIDSLRETQPFSNEDVALTQHAETLTPGHHDQNGQIQAGADRSVAPEGVTFGDVFPVEGALATQPITKEDAALMQRAENLALGHTQKGGAAAAMQSAADYNVQAGAVPKDAHSPIAEEAGVTVVTTILPKDTVLTQFVVAGQPIPSGPPTQVAPAAAAKSLDAVTIGEALEAAAMRAGDTPIEASDASAIQCAEKRATRGIPSKPGGLAATAQSAAVLNPRVEEFSKTTIADVLMDASAKLPRDKAVTWADAEKVAEVELRNNPTNELRATGIAAALVTAAELNEKKTGARAS